MNNLIKKLNEPFPDRASLRENFSYVVGAGIFVALFLYFIQPFGLHNYPKNPIWICLGFGTVTIIAGVIYDIFELYVLKLEKDIPSWTFWKWMLNMLGLILFISICNYLYMLSLSAWPAFSWKQFLYMIYSTLAIGIFPIIFSGLMVQMNAYKRNQKQAENLQAALSPIKKPIQTVKLTSQNSSQNLEVPITNLLYLEAQQNYVSICHLENAIIRKTLFRNTIKQMETQLSNTPLFRCHRSFLVNTALIQKVAGNAQGLRLTLNNLPDFEVPVSRKYIPTLKSLIS